MHQIRHTMAILLSLIIIMGSMPFYISADNGASGDEAAAAGDKEISSEAETQFDASESDYLAYDPLFIEKYANREYLDVDAIEMDRYVNIVTAAKGIATYNLEKQGDFEVSEKNYLAGMNYEMPVYDIDDSSKYYVAVPNVNKFNSKFKAYDIMVAYNNDNGENIEGCKFEKGILYIPKKAVDRPKNEEDIPETELIAVQLNYAVGDDLDFSKKIPVQILSGSKPKKKSVSTGNLFDPDALTVETGIRNRKKSDISVFLNGHMIPVNRDAWTYEKSSGRLSVQAMPGIVDCINVVFENRKMIEKAADLVTGAVDLFTAESYAVSLNNMTNLRNEDDEEVVLKFDTSRMFVGWRGRYKSSRVWHTSDSSKLKNLSEWENSVSYLYGGRTSMAGADYATHGDSWVDGKLESLWAIQSYTVGADVGLDTNTNNIQYGTEVTHHVTKEKTETHTMYEWLMANRNELEKSYEVYADGQGNSIGGSNNFAANWPITKLEGSSLSLAPEGRENPDIKIESDQLSSDEWFAASCSELDDAAMSDEDNNKVVYVTCLDIDDEYVVLSMCQARTGQNMCAIYKFKVEPKGYVYIRKQAAEKDTDFLKEAPDNYSLESAVYQLYTDSELTKRAKDTDGRDITFTIGKDGKSGVAEVRPGTYYAREVTASAGFKKDTAVRSVEVTSSNTKDKPACITSIEEPVYGSLIKLRKNNSSGDYGWKKLTGAEYTLRYYDVDPSLTDVSAYKVKRSWVFKTVKKTDEAGRAYAGIDFAADEPVSGSSFYLIKGKRVMPCGVFTIEETKAPSGLARNTSVYSGRVYQPSNGSEAKTESNTGSAKDMSIITGSGSDVENDEDLQYISIVINKVNADTGKNEASESEASHSSTRKALFSSLAGAQYEVYYDDYDLAAPELIGVITTDENGHGELSKREMGDERYIGCRLRTGSYLINELKAPPGFVTDQYELKNGTQAVREDCETEVICSYDDSGEAVTKTIGGSYKGGRHLFRARAEKSGTEVFTYTVTSLEKGTELHICKTDAVTSKEVPGARLQLIAMNGDEEGDIVEDWVSGESEHIIREIPAGEYKLREITAPYGYDIAEDAVFEVKEDQIITRAKMKNKPLKLETTALNEESLTHHGIRSENEIIIDRVKISGLCKGKRYRIKGRLVDKYTGDPLKDAEGNDAEGESEEFTAEGDTAEAEIRFTVDSSGFTESSAAVAYEKLYRTEAVRDEIVPVELARHEDLSDEAQSIHYGGIAQTKAADKKTGKNKIRAKKDVTIKDIVVYRNLSPENKYLIEGELYDKTDGKLTGIRGSTEFIPENEDGVTYVEFNFDASSYEGHKLVVFEKLLLNGRTVSEHEDENDADQTVWIRRTKVEKGPKTGERENLMIYFALGGISLAALVLTFIIIKKRRSAID